MQKMNKMNEFFHVSNSTKGENNSPIKAIKPCESFEIKKKFHSISSKSDRYPTPKNGVRMKYKYSLSFFSYGNNLLWSNKIVGFCSMDVIFLFIYFIA